MPPACGKPRGATRRTSSADEPARRALKKLTRSQSSAIAGDGPLNRGGAVSERLDETTDVPVFPAELIGMLPNLEYIAILSGGNLIKGRYYLILRDKSEYRRG